MPRLTLLLILVFAGICTSVHPSFALYRRQASTPETLFDDFDYEAHDDPSLSENGWIIRTVNGWPGVPGAIWREENITFVADPDNESNHLLQMTSSAEGESTYQTQICHQRKYYEGTYAARVHFSNLPVSGSDGDQIVQTFYLISPQEYNLAPNYSELDFEYLPNGGWGFRDNVLFATTWETFQLEPWIADNTSELIEEDFEGWHTLVIQISDEEANYFVDGEHFALHADDFYPEEPMSINFNLWFINGGQIESDALREYVEQVDWVFFANNVVLTPDQIEDQVVQLREAEMTFTDLVPEWDPPLESPCNF